MRKIFRQQTHAGKPHSSLKFPFAFVSKLFDFFKAFRFFRKFSNSFQTYQLLARSPSASFPPPRISTLSNLLIAILPEHLSIAIHLIESFNSLQIDPPIIFTPSPSAFIASFPPLNRILVCLRFCIRISIFNLIVFEFCLLVYLNQLLTSYLPDHHLQHVGHYYTRVPLCD